MDDLPALVAAHHDPALRRWLAHSLADGAEARQWLAVQAAGWDSATRFSFAVVTGENNRAPVRVPHLPDQLRLVHREVDLDDDASLPCPRPPS